MPAPTISLVCSSCSAVNRVPSDRTDDRPICGKCQTPLLPTAPIELSDQTFDRFIAKTSIPIVVDFWAAWCGPCRMMAPSFAEAAEHLSPGVVFAKLDTDASPASASRFSLAGIPTVMLFLDGREVGRQTGAMNTEQIVRWVSDIV